MSLFTSKIFRGFLLALATTWTPCTAQETSIEGIVLSEGEPVPFVNIRIKGSGTGTSSDARGFYRLENLNRGTFTLIASALGYEPYIREITLADQEQTTLDIVLLPSVENLDDIVVSGTLKPVRRLESPVPVEVYSPAFLKKNPTQVCLKPWPTSLG